MEFLIDYNQFKKSKLQPIIQDVLKINYDKAFDIGKKHCNLLSTWGIITDLEVYEETYEDFYKTLLIKNICNKEGYLYLDKPEIFKELCIECKITKYESIPYDLDFNQRFQIAINNKSHFMAGKSFPDNRNIILYDTSSRPFGTELMEALKKTDRIYWIKKYEEVGKC